jgi:GAF domain-containing protein
MLHFLEQVGASVGIAVARQRERQRLERYAKRLEALHEIDGAILEAKSLDGIARGALVHIRKLVPCHRASIAAVDPRQDEAIVLAVVAETETRLGTGARLPLTAFGKPEETHSGRIRITDDLAEAEARSEEEQILWNEGIRSRMTVPLMAEGELVGFLDLAARKPLSFTRKHCEVALEVADVLAVAIRQGRVEAELRERLEELERQLAERAQES